MVILVISPIVQTFSVPIQAPCYNLTNLYKLTRLRLNVGEHTPAVPADTSGDGSVVPEIPTGGLRGYLAWRCFIGRDQSLQWGAFTGRLHVGPDYVRPSKYRLAHRTRLPFV